MDMAVQGPATHLEICGEFKPKATIKEARLV